MARKRAPGGGRKPAGPFAGKSATFTTRIRPETRRALEEAAKKTRHSLSQVVENYLTMAMEKPAGEPHNRALGYLVAQVAQEIQEETEKIWLDDSFTCQALRLAIEALIFHYAPDQQGEFPVPDAIDERAATLAPQFAEVFRTPGGLAQIIAGNLIRRVEQEASHSPPDEWSMLLFDNPRALAAVARDLRVKKKSRRGGQE